MSEKERRGVEGLICDQLEAVQQEMLEYSMRSLDSGGLHFSSDVQEVLVQMRNKDRTRAELLQLIVKTLPSQEQQIVNSSKLGFKKEIAFYKLAIPEYMEVQEKGHLEVNNFPKLFAATSDTIILCDLRSLQFTSMTHRMDEEHTKLVLRELAKLHATGVALNFSKPGCFQSSLAPVVTPALQNATNVNRAEINYSLRREVAKLLRSMEGFESFAAPVDVILQNIDNEQLPAVRKPYATLVHNDLWHGNIMFRYSSTNQPLAAAFIDFQNTLYNSPARDLVYFLFTSVDMQVLLDFQSIILYYYKCFIEYLSAFGCDVSDFTFAKLMDEINLSGPTKLKHMILLLKTLSGSTKDYESSFKAHLKQLFTLFQDRHWL